MAAWPSGQTVTSWPRRGISERMNSCSDFSSSANRMRRLLCGDAAKHLLLEGLRRHVRRDAGPTTTWRRVQREPHREGAPPVQTRARCLDLSSVLADDTMADG